MNLCSVEECKKNHYGLGYCRTHYYRFKRNGNVDTIRKKRDHVCSYEGCFNVYNGSGRKGLCRKHYLIQTKDKNYTKETRHGRPKNDVLCKVKDCNKKYYCLNYCRPHYLKYKKYGNPTKIVHKNIHGDNCAVLGCSSLYFLKDYCEKHYWRNQRYGSPYIVKKNNEHQELCLAEDCKNIYWAKNLCKNHYMQYHFPKSACHDDIELYIAMNNVRKRDNNICQWYKCGKSPKDNHIIIHVHHIFPQSEYPELKYKEEYMICYCKFHHAYWHEMRGDQSVVNMIGN